MFYKRPSLRRGGRPEEPTGIEQLSPRVQAQEGIFTRGGNTFFTGRGQNLNDPLTILGFNIPGTQISKDTTPIPKRNFAEDLTFVVGPGKFVKAGGAGMQILKEAGKFATKPNFYGTTSGVSRQTLEKAPFLSNQYFREMIRPYSSGIMETAKTMGRGVKDFTKKYGIATGTTGAGGALAYKGIKDYLDDEGKTTEVVDDFEVSGEAAKVKPGETALDAVLREGKILAEKRAKTDKPGDSGDANTSNDTKPGGLTLEDSFENDFQRLSKRLEKYLGVNKDEEKGKLALALSDAIGTPGSIADKASVLNKALLGIAKGRKKDKRDLAKLAFAAATELEGKRIDAGKLTSTEKARKRYVELANKKNLSSEEQSELRSLEGQFRIDDDKGFSVSASGTYGNLLGDIANKIYNYNQMEKDDPDRQRAKDAITTGLNALLRAEGITKDKIINDLAAARDFFEEGGRVEMQMGGATETPATPVDTKLSFNELRTRLPKEITDDIVRLVSTSEEALQDFAYIRTQGDVEKFNTKYGVNLVLPQQTA